MTQLFDHPDKEAQATGTAPVDRRRPGRIDQVDPSLIPLLRHDTLIETALAQRDADDLGPAKGIGVGVLVGVLLWAGAVVLGWWIFAA